MAKIETYALDTDITGLEKLLASQATTNDTVNILVSALKDYTHKNAYTVANEAARLALTVSPGAQVFQADTEVLYLKKTSGWVVII
jgi:hypothetical protein